MRKTDKSARIYSIRLTKALSNTMSGRRGILGVLLDKKDTKNSNSLCVRPPYANASMDFLSVCSHCQDTPCVGACEEEIIFLDAAQTPCLDFTKRGCTFCEACAKACPSGILELSNDATLLVEARIDVLSCMAWHQSICNSCLDACDASAIRFLGLFRPEIKADACTGCGWCIARCPSDAIALVKKEA